MADIDWEALARRVGALSDTSTKRSYEGQAGAVETRAALATLLGDDVVRSAVRHAVSLKPGAALAANVVAEVRGRVAMDECLRLYRELENEDLRLNAVRILYDAGDGAVLPFLNELLRDPSPKLHRVVASVVYKLAMGAEIEAADALAILEPMATAADDEVRSQAAHLLPAIRELADQAT